MKALARHGNNLYVGVVRSCPRQSAEVPVIVRPETTPTRLRDLGGASTPKSWLHSHPLLLPPSRRPFRGPGHSARIAKRPCCFGQYGRPIVTHPTFVVAPVARMARQSKMYHN